MRVCEGGREGVERLGGVMALVVGNEVRKQLLEAIYAGRPFRQVLRNLA
jgi:hypothetical protein